MGFRDLRASLEQFNLAPVDPEADKQARIERLMSETARFSGLSDEDLLDFSEPVEEWTVVYDKFQVYRR